MINDRLLERWSTGNLPRSTDSIEIAIDTRERACAPPTASIAELARLMVEREVSYVAIVEESQTVRADDKFLKPLGFVRAGDLLKWCVQELDWEKRSSDPIASTPISCVSSTETLELAYQIVQQQPGEYVGVCGTRGEWRGWITPASLLRAIEPGEIYPIEVSLERRASQLELEKVQLLRDFEVEVERQVRHRTAELQKQVDALAQSLRKAGVRQPVETELREGEEKFRQLAENIREVFFIHDAKSFQALYISPAFEEIWGFSSDRVYENAFAWIDVVHPEDRDRFVAEARQRRGKTAFEREYRIIRPDGGIRWIRERSFPVRDRSGAIYRLAGIAEDITERKCDREALERLNQQLETIVEQRTFLLKQTNDRLQAQMKERQQIETEIATRARQQAIVAELGQQALAGVDLHEVANQLAIQVAAGLNVDYCKMLEILPDTRSFLTLGIQGSSPQDSILLDREPVSVGRWEIDLMTHKPHVLDRNGGSSLSVSIQGKTACFGILGAYTTQPRAFTQDDINFLQSAANVLAAAIERQQSQTALLESEAQYRRTIETAAEGIWTLDANRKTIFVNPKMAKMLGYSVEDMLGRRMSDFMDEESRAIAIENVRQHTDKPIEQKDFQFRRRDGFPVWAIVSATPIFQPTGQYTGVLMMLTDITARKQAEAAIERQHRMSQLFAEIALQICRSLQLDDILQTTVTEVQKIFDCDRVLIYRLLPDGSGHVMTEAVRPGVASLLDLCLPPAALSPTSGQDTRSVDLAAIDRDTSGDTPPPLPQRMQQWGVRAELVVEIVQHAKPWGFIVAHQCSSGRSWTDFETELLEQLADRVGIALAQAQLLAARQESEARFRAMFEQAAVGIVQNDLNGKFIRCNQKSCDILGYSCAELLTKTPKEMTHPEDIALDRHSLEQLLRQEIPTFSVEKRLIRKDDSIVWVNVTVSLVLNCVGKPDYFISAIEDIGDRKAALFEREQAQAKLQASLHEKEVLLKEIHHRVKNNLYIISNLLDLQSETLEDPKSQQLFADSQNRLQTMALIHEQLYKTTDLATIDFTDYIHNLVNNLYYSYDTTGGEIQISIEAEPVMINLETAIPCGLIVNELVTNSFKYAFDDRQSGELKIELYCDIEGDSDPQVHLRICDNGRGIPDRIDWKNTPSLGLRLVNILTEQLEAEITLDRRNGTCFHLVFCELKYNNRF